eukprot:Sspe_Gene.30372::Locus_15032_Transcript_1_1_Confidence_1.000_Length_2586::g.30372::m.30372
MTSSADSANKLPSKWVWSRFLGRGSYGSVYLAFGGRVEDEELTTPFAVKVFELTKDADPSTIAVVLREVEVMKSIPYHPHIVQCQGSVFEETGKLCIIMEFMAGGSLGAYLRRSERMDEKTAAMCIRQVVEGVAHLHRHGVYHRDLKGDNILMHAVGEGDVPIIKLADFGASKRRTTQAVTMSLMPTSTTAHFQTVAGTALWMAPDVIRSVQDTKGYCAMKADVWSVGVVACETLTGGKAPWPAFDNAVQALFTIGQWSGGPSGEDLPPDAPTDVSRSCTSFLSACLHANPEKRHKASKLLEHPFIASLPPLPSPPTPPPEEPPQSLPTRAVPVSDIHTLQRLWGDLDPEAVPQHAFPPKGDEPDFLRTASSAFTHPDDLISSDRASEKSDPDDDDGEDEAGEYEGGEEGDTMKIMKGFDDLDLEEEYNNTDEEEEAYLKELEEEDTFNRASMTPPPIPMPTRPTPPPIPNMQHQHPPPLLAQHRRNYQGAQSGPIFPLTQSDDDIREPCNPCDALPATGRGRSDKPPIPLRRGRHHPEPIMAKIPDRGNDGYSPKRGLVLGGVMSSSSSEMPRLRSWDDVGSAEEGFCVVADTSGSDYRIGSPPDASLHGVHRNSPMLGSGNVRRLATQFSNSGLSPHNGGSISPTARGSPATPASAQSSPSFPKSRQPSNGQFTHLRQVYESPTGVLSTSVSSYTGSPGMSSPPINFQARTGGAARAAAMRGGYSSTNPSASPPSPKSSTRSRGPSVKEMLSGYNV